MTDQDIINLNRKYVFFPWAVQSQVAPIPAVRSEGGYFWDADRKRYLDFSSQLMNVNSGHGNQKIVHAIQEQVGKMAYVYPGIADGRHGPGAGRAARTRDVHLCQVELDLCHSTVEHQRDRTARRFAHPRRGAGHHRRKLACPLTTGLHLMVIEKGKPLQR